MPIKWNSFTNNFDYVEDTSSFLTEIQITTNTGTATWTATGDLVGTGSMQATGSGDTVSVSLIGLSNHAVLVGAGTDTITKVGPSSGVGQVLQSNGISADPSFSTATYPSTAGASGNVLTSDGTNWTSTAPSTGSSFGYTSTYYYYANLTANVSTSSNKALTAGRTYVIPFYVSETVTFDRFAFSVAGPSTAGTRCRFGIYNNVGSFPTTVLADLGTALTDSAVVVTVTINIQLTEGYYFMALQTEDAPTIVATATSANRSSLVTVGTSFSTAGTAGYTYNSTPYGSGLADLTGVTPNTFENAQPIIQLRVS